MLSNVAKLSNTNDIRNYRTKRLCLDLDISLRSHSISF
jgi:hypothetical protein